MPAPLIFDIDGTPKPGRKPFAGFGYDLPLERIRSQIGKGGDQLLPVFAFHRLGKGIERKDVIVVGDSPYDDEPAKRAGMKAVSVRCGVFAETELLCRAM